MKNSIQMLPDSNGNALQSKWKKAAVNETINGSSATAHRDKKTIKTRSVFELLSYDWYR